MHSWRVTRYDPSHRNPPGVRPVGAYAGETWTSVADVGKRFEDVELTIDEYQRVEDAYVDALRAFMRDARGGDAHRPRCRAA
jgi:hypothetical protein